MTGTALARAALAGNPSDGFGGAVLAVCIADLRAEVRISRRPGVGLTVGPPEAGPLVRTAAARHAAATGEPTPALHASVRTTIPREVGLAGSSAIVIATLRALDALLGTEIGAAALPPLALAAERDLGIHAGLQDRVAQTHGGLTAMTFGLDGTHTARPLDPSRLPPLLLAWDTRGAEHSGTYHGMLRERWDSGEPRVRRAMEVLAEHAAEAADAAERGDAAALGAAMDASFDLRAALGPLPRRHVELVLAARRHGLAVNFAGSGGAVVALCPEVETLAALRADLARQRCHVRPLRLPLARPLAS